MPKANKPQSQTILEALAVRGISKCTPLLELTGREEFLESFEPTGTGVKRLVVSDQGLTTSRDRDSEDSRGSDRSSDTASTSSSQRAGEERAVPEFVFDSKRVTSVRKHPPASRGQQGEGLPAGAPHTGLRRFLSNKAGEVHRLAPGRQQHTSAPRSKDDGMPSRSEFLKMQKEVQVYGASALDKGSRKSFEAGVLTQLGAKPAKAPRVAAIIGKGMAKKQAERKTKALEDAIAAGMVSRKGLAKRKRQKQLQQRKKLGDWGLNEDQGNFRRGMLRVERPTARQGNRRGSIQWKGTGLS